MRNSLYYGEIADTITAHLYKNPDHILQIDRNISEDGNPNDTVWSVVSEAAYIFEHIEDLADNDDLDWMKAVGEYSNEVLDHLIVGQKPTALDLIEMASRSVQAIH